MLLCTGERGKVKRFDAVIQLDGFACGGNEVKPAAGNVQLGESEDGVGDLVAMMVVIKQPGIEILLPQGLLNRCQVHRGIL